MLCQEQYQYNEFPENNSLLDDAIVYGLEGKKRRHHEVLASTSERILTEDDIYNDLTETSHIATELAAGYRSSSDDESLTSDLTTDMTHGVHFLL